MNRISVALFRNSTDAEPIQRRLIDAGIKAELKSHLWWESLWFVSKTNCCWHLEVPATQFEPAEDILCSLESQGLMNGAVHCPDCGSFRVDYPQFTRKSTLTNVFMGIGSELHLVDKNFYCEDCHLTWPRDGEHIGKVRPHSAPNYFIEGVEGTSDSRARSNKAISTASPPR
jgi:hypothetical protein